MRWITFNSQLMYLMVRFKILTISLYLGYSGRLGKFTLSLRWMNLGNQPVEILVEDIYLLVVPTVASQAGPDEEEQRAQAAKAERLENAELLYMQGQAAEIQGGKYSQL